MWPNIAKISLDINGVWVLLLADFGPIRGVPVLILGINSKEIRNTQKS